MKNLRISVDGKSYDVTVEVIGEEAAAAAPRAPRAAAAPVAAPVAAPAPAPAAAPAAAGAGSVPSPLSGKVVAIDAKPGASVNEGDTLMTLEAMKMNTFVTAPAAGTVKDVLVNVGDAVEEGQALVNLG